MPESAMTPRDLTEGLQHREMPAGALQLREEDGSREVAGIGVPYNSPVDLGFGIREEFAPGSVQADESTKLFWRHAEPIGRVVSSSNKDDGWHHRSVISKTATGDEAYTLARDGVVDRFSVGFEPIEHLETKADDGTITITHTKVRVREVSLVPFPMYDGATLTEVRSAHRDSHRPPHEEDPMPDTNTAPAVSAEDIDEIRSGLDELTRRVEVGLTPATTDTGQTTGARSFGEFVQRIAAGDELATRAYTGAVSGDFILEDAWVGDLVDVIHQRQIVANTFVRANDLPSKGLTVEYGVIGSDTTQVAEQAAEGDDLAFGKVSVTTENAPVATLGGWTSLSRQAIERTSNVSVLDTTFRAMAEKYGRAVEAKARAALTAYLQSATVNTVTGDLVDADSIIDALVDLAVYFDDAGLSFDGMFVDSATFKAVAKVAESSKALQFTGAPADKQGTISVNTLSANLSGIVVKLLPNVSYTPSGGTATTSLVLGYDRSAIRTQESPGAPVRLQDESIINLTKDFSVYGYAASYTQRPSGLVVLEAGV